MVKKAVAEEPRSPEPAQKSRKVANEGPQVGGVFRYTLITVFASMIAILVGAWLIQTQLMSKSIDKYGSQMATSYAYQYAGFFNQVFSQASRQLSGVAAAGSTVRAVASGDPAQMASAAETIAASLGSKSQVFLIAEQHSTSEIPLGFAAQNMAERARRGEEIKAEVIPFKENPLLLLAYSVRDQQRVIGVLLVGFDLNEISANLKIFDANSGYMSLVQRFEDSPEEQTVLSYGSASHQSSPFAQSVETIHPNLRIVFSLNPQLLANDTAQLYWIAIAAMILLVIASIFLAHLLLRRALFRNSSMLLQFAESLLRRAPTPAGIQFDIDVFQEVASSLSRVPAAGGSDGTRAPVPAARRTARVGSLDVEISGEDASLLDADDDTQASGGASQLPDEIFRAYDIRGVVGKTLTEDTVRLLGQAIGSEALDAGQQAIYVGRDGRLSGPQLVEALIQGLTSTGCRVINLGMVATPLVYFACNNSAVKSGVILTGSHNPADHNGLKIVINGETLADKRIQGLKERVLKRNFRTGKGAAETQDIAPKYVERIRDDIVLARPMKIVVDCGNGIAGATAPGLLSSLGCSVIPLFCDVDGHFPNHHPDPSKPDNLRDLIAKVTSEGADLGLAFDGDGDRIGVVTPQGNIIWPDRLMMLFAKDLLMRSPGADIIFDVKCTRDLAAVISQHGGRPVMWKTGHSLIKAKLKETGAALAGEMSGHIFFNDRWPGFDDAMYAAARLLEILSLEVAPADEVFAEFPSNISTPELHINVSEDSKFRLVEQLQKQGDFSGGSVNTIDGVRVDYPASWGLVRASNTTATLVCRFEGRSEADLEQVRTVFRDQLLRIDSALRIPF
ncbi:MAG: phosphomannomutase/phosphoglucomutase [Pseudomonadota bacterium]